MMAVRSLDLTSFGGQIAAQEQSAKREVPEAGAHLEPSLAHLLDSLGPHFVSQLGDLRLLHPETPVRPAAACLGLALRVELA